MEGWEPVVNLDSMGTRGTCLGFNPGRGEISQKSSSRIIKARGYCNIHCFSAIADELIGASLGSK